MKESEALTKWCPMVRYSSIRGNGINRWADDGDTQVTPNASMCIGSKCMMWESFERLEEGVTNKHYMKRKGEGTCGLITKECGE